MNLGFPELVFLFVLGLLLFGPKRLPEVGRQLGKIMSDLKRASQEFQSQLHEEVQKLESEIEPEAPRTIHAPRPDFTTARNEALERETAATAEEPTAAVTKEPNA